MHWHNYSLNTHAYTLGFSLISSFLSNSSRLGCFQKLTFGNCWPDAHPITEQTACQHRSTEVELNAVRLTNLTIHVKSVMQTLADITPYMTNCTLRLFYCTQDCLNPATNHTMQPSNYVQCTLHYKSTATALSFFNWPTCPPLIRLDLWALLQHLFTGCRPSLPLSQW